jgi:DNA gyrase subunit A
MPRTRKPEPVYDGADEKVVDIAIDEEMRTSYLEYAYSVIYTRALPDARDGLKPVQRRLLYTMSEMGLRPERPYVKCSRVVGETMGKYHPHGDTALYDALARMAQDWVMRLPLVDGHGNFGSPDDAPAAMRYTECRMSAAAVAMTDSLDEDVVDFRPNYDGRDTQPAVLPAALPNLLVNGGSGIAVGMATNLAPHNLVEVISALRHLLAQPEATLSEIMRFVPGPDLPTGGKIVGLDGIRDAYAVGRGSFLIRGTTRIEAVTPRRQGIVVTELPYGVGPERLRKSIRDLVEAKRLAGIASLEDHSDMENGLRIVIGVKNGFNPEALLEQLFRLTPLEDNFSINNVALVEGQPRTLGLIDMLRIYLDHRLEVTRRRTEFRHRKATDELHLVEGLLIAVLDIDEVIQVIRTSDDADTARARLIDVFDLTTAQADHILALRLRRLTRFSRLDLERQRDELAATIEHLASILDDEGILNALVSEELAAVAQAFGTPRRTVLLESAGAPVTAAGPLEVADDPCAVLLSSTGLLARIPAAAAPGGPARPGRSKHDVIVSSVPATNRGVVGLVTSTGQVHRLSVLELPALPPTAGAPNLQGGAPLREFLSLGAGEQPLALVSLRPGSPGLALGTADGVVKRVAPDFPAKGSFDLISLKDGDEVVGAVELTSGTEELVFIASDGQLLHFPADAVRPQGRAAGGMAGIRLSAGARAVFFGAVPPLVNHNGDVEAPDHAPVVATVAGSASALPGTDSGSVKVTQWSVYPAKGRGTGGVRAHRFLRGEDTLLLAYAGPGPARAAAGSGAPVDLPAPDLRRDGSGAALDQPVAAISGPVVHVVSDL